MQLLQSLSLYIYTYDLHLELLTPNHTSNKSSFLSTRKQPNMGDRTQSCQSWNNQLHANIAWANTNLPTSRFEKIKQEMSWTTKKNI